MRILTTVALLTTLGYGLTSQMRSLPVETTPASGLKRIEAPPTLAAPAIAAKEITSTFKAPVAKASQPAPISSGGSKEQWMAAAGIPQDQWGYVDSIVSREANWKPCAYNPGLNDCNAIPSSACGLAQSLPCGKQSKYGHWTDPVANLKWQYEYVTGRYGGYAQAVAFWNSNHYY